MITSVLELKSHLGLINADCYLWRMSCTLTLCLVGGIIGRMENNGWKMVWKTVFSTVWEPKEKREDGKLRRKFSSGPTNFFPPKSGGKLWRENVLTMQLLDCPLPMSANSSTTHPYSSTVHPCQTQKINSTPIFIKPI